MSNPSNNLENCANGELVIYLRSGFSIHRLCAKFFDTKNRRPFLRRMDTFEIILPEEHDTCEATGKHMRPYYSDYNDAEQKFHRIGSTWYQDRDC